VNRAIAFLRSGRRTDYSIHAPAFAAYAITRAAELYSPRKLWTVGIQILGQTVDIGRTSQFVTRAMHTQPKLLPVAA